MSLNLKSKLLLAASAIALLCGGIYLGSLLSQSPDSKYGRSESSPEELAAIRAIPKPKDPTTQPRSNLQNADTKINALAGLNDPDSEPQTDILILDHLFREVHTVFHELPIGEHQEIIAFLTGNNDKSLAYFSSEDPNLNGDGELVDRWGTPFFFHALSRHDIEVRSAGPDKLHWSDDDIVSESAAPRS